MDYQTSAILTQDSIKCHTEILKFPWARLWYLCRLADRQGQGIVNLSWRSLKEVLNCAASTLWHWLWTGKKDKAFRDYKKSGDRLTVYLGAKKQICAANDLDSWGETAYVNFDELTSLTAARSQRAAIATQKAQLASYRATERALDKDERKQYKIATIEQLFSKTTSLCRAGVRETNFLLKVSDRHFFVSKGFLCYGASQEKVALSLGVSDRTLRRHLEPVERRQIVQTKYEYSRLYEENLFTGGGGINEAYTIEDRAGHSSRVNRLVVCPARFFKCMDKIWLAKNNLYNLNYQLVKERTQRQKYKQFLSKRKNFPAECLDKN